MRLKRLIAFLLIISTLSSSSIALADGGHTSHSGYTGHGDSYGNARTTGGKGDYNDENYGYRVYLFDSKGNVVSNVVDFVNTSSTTLNSIKGISEYYLSTKLGNGLGYNIIDMSKTTQGAWPKPMIFGTGNNIIANGETVKQWLLGNAESLTLFAGDGTGGEESFEIDPGITTMDQLQASIAEAREERERQMNLTLSKYTEKLDDFTTQLLSKYSNLGTYTGEQAIKEGETELEFKFIELQKELKSYKPDGKLGLDEDEYNKMVTVLEVSFDKAAMDLYTSATIISWPTQEAINKLSNLSYNLQEQTNSIEKRLIESYQKNPDWDSNRLGYYTSIWQYTQEGLSKYYNEQILSDSGFNSTMLEKADEIYKSYRNNIGKKYNDLKLGQTTDVEQRITGKTLDVINKSENNTTPDIGDVFQIPAEVPTEVPSQTIYDIAPDDNNPSTAEELINSDRSKYGNFDESDNISDDTYDAADIIRDQHMENLIDLKGKESNKDLKAVDKKYSLSDILRGILLPVNAAEVTNTASITDAKLSEILSIQNSSGEYLFKLKLNQPLEVYKKELADKADPEKNPRLNNYLIPYICSKEGYKVGVEPIIWIKPWNLDGTHKTFRVYGTITNYAQWEADHNYFSGTYAGNHHRPICEIGPYCMYLKKNEDIIPGKVNNITNITNKVPLSVLRNTSLGYAMHWYNVDGSGSGNYNSVPTYNKTPLPELLDPMKLAKGNDLPHPAPVLDTRKLRPPGVDASIRYVPETFNANIVKVYDIIKADGTVDYHLGTYLTVKEPGMIKVQQEPLFKVVEYYTSSDFVYEDFQNNYTSHLVLFGQEPANSYTDWLRNQKIRDLIHSYPIFTMIEESTERFLIGIDGSPCMDIFDCDADDFLTTWDEIKAATPVQNNHYEKSYLETLNSGDADKFGDESTIQTLRIGKAQNANPSTDTVLYVHLVYLPEPSTHTFDEESFPEKGPAPDPTTDPDPEYPNPNPSDPNLIYHIVKVYEEKTGQDIETVEIDIRDHTCPRIYIEDEVEYKLINWIYGYPNNRPSKPDTWEEAISGVSGGESGTSGGTEVSIRDPNDPTGERTLYLEYRKEIAEEVEHDDAIEDLTESQLTKISNSNSVAFSWNNLKYTAAIEAAITSHDYTYHVGSCGSCTGEDGCTCGDCCCSDYNTTCNDVTRKKKDDYVNAVFAILTKDKHETTEATPGAHADFAGKTWGKGTDTGDTVTFEKHIDDSAYNWTLSMDGSDANGVEYITTVSRSSIQDIPNLAKYKKDYMSKETYERVNSIFPQSNEFNSQRKPNSNPEPSDGSPVVMYDETLYYKFGHKTYDDAATSSCIGCGCPRHHSTFENTKHVAYNTHDHDLNGEFIIWVFKGIKTKNAMNGLMLDKLNGGEGFTVLHGSNLSNRTHEGLATSKIYASNQTATIKFYPYIRMSYMITEDNKIFRDYNSFAGYVADPKTSAGRTAYMLSTTQSSIKPTNSVEVSWYNAAQQDEESTGKYSLQMTSQQWSTHQRAINGEDSWRNKNQVLPGGALYQLSTKGTETTIKVVTYGTLVDKNRNDWIKVSNSEKYTAKDIAKSVGSFLTEAENVIENYRIVQWVNKKFDVAHAWDEGNNVKIKTGGEALTSIGLKKNANTDAKYLLTNNDDTKNGPNEADIDIMGRSYTTKVYKGFSDTDGNIYVVWVDISYTASEMNEILKSANKESAMQELFKNKIEAAQKYLEPICGTQLESTESLPAGMTYNKISSNGILAYKAYDTKEKVFDLLESKKTQSGYSELYNLDIKTGWLRNLVESVERNTGFDNRATWLSAKDGKWYNEAFDGYYEVMNCAYYKVGLAVPGKRMTVLDPNLCPPKSSTGDIMSTAHASQFRINEKSSVAEDKEDGYLGTFEGVTVKIPNLTMMFYSRIFYIPNANVQDLS